MVLDLPSVATHHHSKCPCTNVTLFLMGSEAHDDKGNEIQPPQLFSPYYSNWPIFPAEHLDAALAKHGTKDSVKPLVLGLKKLGARVGIVCGDMLVKVVCSICNDFVLR